MSPRTHLATLTVLASVLAAGCLSGPLVVYESAPASVDDAALEESGYAPVNETTTYVNQSLAPVILVDRYVSLQVNLAVYAGPETAAALRGGNATDPAGGAGPDGDGALRGTSVGPGGDGDPSVVVVGSASAMQLGPVAFNPAVYASDPAVLSSAGYAVDYLERWGGVTVTNLTVRGSDPVVMLGRETTVTTLDGRVRADGTSAAVTVKLARVVHEGDLVVVLGLLPPEDPAAARNFDHLVEGVRHGAPDPARAVDRPREATAASPPATR